MILFEWDEAKAESNWRKHRVSFELARAVFLERFALVEEDLVVNGEPRRRTMDLVPPTTILFVAHTIEEKASMRL